MIIKKRIPGFHGYFATHLGEIISIRGTHKQPIFLSQNTMTTGYKRVCLFDENQNRKYLFVHRLVAFSFIPNEGNKPFINHIDNNPSNNCVNNLEWCTQSENIKHAFNQGRKFNIKGEAHPQAKLTDIEVNEIREFAKGKGRYYNRKYLIEKYGVSGALITNIIKNRKRCVQL